MLFIQKCVDSIKETFLWKKTGQKKRDEQQENKCNTVQ